MKEYDRQMNAKRFLIGLVAVSIITFFVSAIVSLIYNLIAHGDARVDWEHSIRLAITFGILVPLLRELEKRKG